MARKKLGCSWVPDLIFVNDCIWHDLEYDKIRRTRYADWVTKSIDRYKADTYYLFSMQRSIKNHNKHKWFYTCVAYLYWLGVRVFGGFVL